jgi:predicted RNA binding protein YcfA (HicA-like mRNA interferase family)
VRATEFITESIEESLSSTITIKDAKKILSVMGFKPTGRKKGSHDIWKDALGVLFTVPLFGKDLSYGVTRALQKLMKDRDYEVGSYDLEEMAGEIHGGVRKALMDKGYKYLGSGIDKQAYLEPGTGQVLIIFGYRKSYKDFSPDQRMFIDWINYCNKNANNPHLPKFSGFESFQFRGKNYIQARMEPLNETSDQVHLLVKQIDDVVNIKKKQNFKKQVKTISDYATFDSADAGEGAYEIEDVLDYLGGEQAAMNLLQTVYKVKKFGIQHGFSIDLHSGNYMQRPDGTIVVNDPFVVWLTSSGHRPWWAIQ